ncbi:MAG: alanine racemase [Pseudomonadota bacterium]
MSAGISLDAALAQVTARDWRPIALAEPVPVARLPTPALLLDEVAFERNLARMAAFLGERGKQLRPHAKTHKCPLIARRQLDLGAAGICVAKVAEAAVMVRAGIDRVLVTSPVTSPDKARLLASLACATTRLDVAVDSHAGLEALAAAAAAADVHVGVLVDVDVAMGRTGVREGDAVHRLAEAAAAAEGLEFRGLQHYAGHVMHVHGHAERRSRSLALWESVQALVERLTARGLVPEVVTGGGTGTYDIDCEVAEITDLQVGSYIFMDQEYRLIGGRGGATFDDFEVALEVAAAAISQPVSGAVTVDGGFKAFASDTVAPAPRTEPEAKFRFAGDEHGVVIPGAGSDFGARLQRRDPGELGRIHRFIAPHCDPTVNLYDWYWICRDGMATAMWPIAARGCSW